MVKKRATRKLAGRKRSSAGRAKPARKKTVAPAAIDLRPASGTPRWNADPDEVRRSVLKLVLTLVEFIRQILERQAIRRMEGGTLSDAETEAVGLALMRLEETIRDLCGQFDIEPGDLNLDLGPIGKLV